MLQKVEGLVLRSIKYSETSLICDVYTRELGLRTYIISGVRRKKSRIAPGLLQPMALVDLVVYHREDKDINRIKEIKPSYIYQSLPFDVAKGAIGLFMTEVVQRTLKDPLSQPHLFDFLKQSYQYLDHTTLPVAHYPSWFLVHFAPYLGLRPHPKAATVALDTVFDYATGQWIGAETAVGHHYFFDAQNTQLLAAFLDLDRAACSSLGLSSADRRSFLEDLLRYYRYHLENFGTLNSLEVLQTVFA